MIKRRFNPNSNLIAHVGLSGGSLTSLPKDRTQVVSHVVMNILHFHKELNPPSCPWLYYPFHLLNVSSVEAFDLLNSRPQVEYVQPPDSLKWRERHILMHK